MRKALVILAILSAIGGAALAAPNGNACPDSSKNPTGTPPNCGHGPKTCSVGLLDGSGVPVLGDKGTVLNKDKSENGPISQGIHTSLEGPLPAPAKTVVHEANCTGVITAEDLLP